MTTEEKTASPQPQAFQPWPGHVPSVTECSLRLTAVRLLSLVCAPGDLSAGIPSGGEVNSRGTLDADSLTATGFVAEVSWALEYPKNSATPLTVSGKHRLTFSIDKPISKDAADYYSVINSVILVFPYLRQLIDDLTVKCLGRNIMIAPLDVPRFTRERIAEKREALSKLQQDEGLGPDAKKTIG